MTTSAAPDPFPLVTDPDLLNQATLRTLDARVSASGEIVLPCLPSMLEDYMQRLKGMFAALRKPLPTGETEDYLRRLLAFHLEKGFQESPHACLIIQFQPSQSNPMGMACNVTIETFSIAENYNKWLETRTPPLFGSHPDAKVLAVVSQIPDPATAPILDIGAGTGRNTLPLAKLGYPVDALEITPGFAEELRTQAAAENLPVTVILGDVLDPEVPLRAEGYKLAIVVEVLSDFRSPDQIRQVLSRLCDHLQPGGLLLFNLFLAATGYEPTPMARELGPFQLSSIFTRGELAEALTGLPLQILSDESVYEYEHQHLPEASWPPTGWFSTWSTGRDLFFLEKGRPPMELRWILCRRI